MNHHYIFILKISFLFSISFPSVQAQNLSQFSTARETPVEFATSCNEELRVDFNQAVEMLHSFEYSESERMFRAILEADPGCQMARWGVAMNMWHPLWALPSESDLATGAAIIADIDKSLLSPRELGFAEALELFYQNYQNIPHQDRAIAYEQSMQTVYENNLDEPEAAVFYALSLLSTADPTDKSYGKQFKAAGILNWVKTEIPEHPGVLHYLIHSYDYPGLAHLALDSAMIYAQAAPASTHAQHMPSHIFTRLGLWDRSIGSNHDSTSSAVEYTARANLSGHYDEGLHSIDYLMYALLQTAQDNEAQQLLIDLREIKKTNQDNFKVAYTYASSPARYALERRQWQEAADITLQPEDFPWQEFSWAVSIHHFARGIGAARSNQLELARQELAAIQVIAESLPQTTQIYLREEVFVHIDAVSAWILLAEGNISRALVLAEAAADREDAVDKHPVTPGEVLPARELFADILLEASRPEQAMLNYQQVLTGSPNRANALLGAARAAVASGDIDIAADYYALFVNQTASGEQGRVGISEAREFLTIGPGEF